ITGAALGKLGRAPVMCTTRGRSLTAEDLLAAGWVDVAHAGTGRSSARPGGRWVLSRPTPDPQVVREPFGEVLQDRGVDRVQSDLRPVGPRHHGPGEEPEAVAVDHRPQPSGQVVLPRPVDRDLLGRPAAGLPG